MARKMKHAHPSDVGRAELKLALIILVLVVLVVGVIFALAYTFEKTKLETQFAQYPKTYSQFVEKFAAENELDPHFVYAVIRTESKFDETAVSTAGAVGLMQITPRTFDWMKTKMDDIDELDVGALYVPDVNIKVGTFLLRFLYDTFGDWNVTLAAYNAGYGSAMNWLDDPEISPDGKTFDVEKIPYGETKNYIKKVNAAKQRYDELYNEK